MVRITHIVLLLVLLLLAACNPRSQPTAGDAPAAPATEPSEMPTSAPATEESETGSEATLDLSITDDGIEGPASVPSGWTTISFTNGATSYHDWMVLKVNEGRTTQEVKDALIESPDMPPPFIQIYGDAHTESSEVASYATNLVPGHYVIVSEGETAEGRSDFSEAVLHELTVTEAGNGSPAPIADVEIELVDFSFVFKGEIEAGEQTLLATNTGNEWHHGIIFKVEEGTTFQDLEPWFSDEPPGDGPPPFEEAGGIGVMSPGVSVAYTYSFEPGSYIAVCFLPSMSGEGMPHFMMGMVSEFTVR